MSGPQTRFEVNTNDVAARNMGGEIIIINLSSGAYYSIEGTGSIMWDLFASGHTAGEVLDDISTRYGVPRETAQPDITAFLEELTAEHLLKESDALEEPVAVEGKTSTTSEAYERPVLNAYRDMGELLALDPPMPGLQDIPWEGGGGTT